MNVGPYGALAFEHEKAERMDDAQMPKFEPIRTPHANKGPPLTTRQPLAHTHFAGLCGSLDSTAPSNVERYQTSVVARLRTHLIPCQLGLEDARLIRAIPVQSVSCTKLC